MHTRGACLAAAKQLCRGGGGAGFTLKKKDFFKNSPTIAVFAVAGTLLSTLVFGLLTYFLVIIHVVQRSALGPTPLTECMLYGADGILLGYAFLCVYVCDIWCHWCIFLTCLHSGYACMYVCVGFGAFGAFF